MVILGMRRGLSYSAAMQVSLRDNHWKQGQLLQGIYENVVFSQQGPVVKRGRFAEFINQIHTQFRSLHEDPHQGIDRLCNFRRNIQERLSFRQKSRQIWTYFGFQLGLLTVIYVGLFGFVVSQYGFFAFKNSFLLSLFFYFLDVVFTFIIARIKKWRI
jgi:hypothetical protein